MGNTTVSPTHEQLFGGATSSNARFVDPASIPMDEVRERLKQQCAYKPSLEINFVMSRDSKMLAFGESSSTSRMIHSPRSWCTKRNLL